MNVFLMPWNCVRRGLSTTILDSSNCTKSHRKCPVTSWIGSLIGRESSPWRIGSSKCMFKWCNKYFYVIFLVEKVLGLIRFRKARRSTASWILDSSGGELITLLFLYSNHFSLYFNLFTFVIIFSYRPGISSSFVKETLAFVDVEKCVEWLTALGVVFISTDKANIDCKTSMSALTAF